MFDIISEKCKSSKYSSKNIQINVYPFNGFITFSYLQKAAHPLTAIKTLQSFKIAFIQPK